MPAARRARRPTVPRSREAAPPAPIADHGLPRAPGPQLAEEPHAHIVCRSCGRIQRLDLTELDRHLLTELAGLTPDGWSVERVAYSLAGACRRCREGPTGR